MTGVLFKNESGTDYVGFEVKAETVPSARNWYGVGEDNTVWMKYENVSGTNRIMLRCSNDSDFMYDGDKLSAFYSYLKTDKIKVESIGRDYVFLCVPSEGIGSIYEKMRFVRQPAVPVISRHNTVIRKADDVDAIGFYVIDGNKEKVKALFGPSEDDNVVWLALEVQMRTTSVVILRSGNGREFMSRNMDIDSVMFKVLCGSEMVYLADAGYESFFLFIKDTAGGYYELFSETSPSEKDKIIRHRPATADSYEVQITRLNTILAKMRP